MEPVLETDAGPVRGAREGALCVFRSVPFAAPPVGALRFAAPEPPPRWQGLRDARRCGPAPPQHADLWSERLGLGRDFETGEDCLALNVWTPGVPGRRPILVWIPGGAFVTGTGNAPVYAGARLALRGDAVVVTLNYRVGALGFLFLDGAGGLAAANLGHQDQLAALAWVRAHAERLGGDPDRVTVFGESAGAGSIAALLAMPAARGAFRRAIAQSPACDGMLAPEEAARRTERFLAKLGLARAGAARLRELPVERLLAAQAECLAEGPFATGMLFPPVVDGRLLPSLPLAAVASGAARGVDLVIGTTADEMMLYGADEPAGVPDAARAKLLAAQLGGAPAERMARAQRLLAAYRAARAGRGASTSARDVFYAVLTDLHLRLPALRLAAAQTRAGGCAFAYLFEWRSPLRGGAYGACHAVDLAFAFGAQDQPSIADFAGSGPTAERLAGDVMDAWLAFAATGDPSHAGIGAWPCYTEESRETMRLGERCGAARAPLEAERAAGEACLAEPPAGEAGLG